MNNKNPHQRHRQISEHPGFKNNKIKANDRHSFPLVLSGTIIKINIVVHLQYNK